LEKPQAKIRILAIANCIVAALMRENAQPRKKLLSWRQAFLGPTTRSITVLHGKQRANARESQISSNPCGNLVKRIREPTRSIQLVVEKAMVLFPIQSWRDRSDLSAFRWQSTFSQIANHTAQVSK
jgi:hypothetical protein